MEASSWPSADGLVADDDAWNCNQILDHAKAQRKPEIEPDRMGDNVDRKTVAAITGIWHFDHGAKLDRKPPPSAT